MTFRDLQALLTRWQEREARQDRRTQQIVWILAEINRDSTKRPSPYELSDFALHQWGLLPHDESAADGQALDDEQRAWAQINTMKAGVSGFWGPISED